MRHRFGAFQGATAPSFKLCCNKNDVETVAWSKLLRFPSKLLFVQNTWAELSSTWPYNTHRYFIPVFLYDPCICSIRSETNIDLNTHKIVFSPFIHKNRKFTKIYNLESRGGQIFMKARSTWISKRYYACQNCTPQNANGRDLHTSSFANCG